MFCLNVIRTCKLVKVSHAWRGQTSLFTFKFAPWKAAADLRGMATAINGRLKREDIRNTKYDSDFSPWMVLIGPDEWQDNAMGKQGAERYRKHILAGCTNGPGVYEHGVPTIWPLQCEVLTIPRPIVLATYLGNTKNLWIRLQQYGRDGAHLENGRSRPKLFSRILSVGKPILFRVLPTMSKEEAEELEKEQLRVLDYMWNERCNGKRRPDDILRKLEFYAKVADVFPVGRTKGLRL